MKTLAPLGQSGVLLLDSGGIIHNPRRMDWHGEKPWKIGPRLSKTGLANGWQHGRGVAQLSA